MSNRGRGRGRLPPAALPEVIMSDDPLAGEDPATSITTIRTTSPTKQGRSQSVDTTSSASSTSTRQTKGKRVRPTAESDDESDRNVPISQPESTYGEEDNEEFT